MSDNDFFVGLQIHPMNYVDEGIEQVFEDTRRLGRVNAHLVMANYGSSGLRRPMRMPLRHNPRRSTYDLYGGYYSEPHLDYYKNTLLKPFKTIEPDLKDRDILEEIIPVGHKMGFQMYAYITEDATVIYPGHNIVAAVDAMGRLCARPCVNNPDYLGFLTGMVEDYTRNYDLDGLFISYERGGFIGVEASPVGALLLGTTPGCFCPYCARRSKEMGFDIERAREGCLKLLRLIRDPDANKTIYGRSWFHILQDYPEIMMLQHMWVENCQGLYARAYGLAKVFKPDIKISGNMFHRASIDYSRLGENMDWIKSMVYQKIDGHWWARQYKKWASSLFRNSEPAIALQMIYDLMGINCRPSLDADYVCKNGFPVEYVYDLMKISIDEVNGKAPVYPGIEVGIEFLPETHPIVTDASEIRNSVRQAFRFDIEGVVWAAFYEAMAPEHLRAASETLLEYRIV